MTFYDTVTVLHTIEEDEFGEIQLVLLNGVHNSTSKYGIAEPGGYYEISELEAKEILKCGNTTTI